MAAPKSAKPRGPKRGGTSDPTTIVIAAAGAADVNAAVAANPNLRLMGYAIKETVAAAATIAIVQGATGAAGTEIGADHALAASGEKERWFDGDGISVPNGISIDRKTGTTKVTLYTRIA